jgi:glycosyltransferase involved in cell wall biosynthesis
MPTLPTSQNLKGNLSEATAAKPQTASSEKRPLVTFALFAYNQEHYIREAVEGAFSQTYSPLEIILSDDCSSDSTFTIIEELAASYQGSHKVILNRNEKNLGIAGHCNRVMELSSGEWIVFAAGDDISLPSRVSTTLRVAEQHPDAYSVMLGVTAFGEGRSGPVVLERVTRFPDTLKRGNGVTVGASHACRRESYSLFGPVPKGVWEDTTLGFRSSLLGTIVTSGEVAVRYRLHPESVSSSQILGQTGLPRIRRELAIATCMKRDLELALQGGWVDADTVSFGASLLERLMETDQGLLAIAKEDRILPLLGRVFKLLLHRDPYRNVFWKLKNMFFLWRSRCSCGANRDLSVGE